MLQLSCLALKSITQECCSFIPFIKCVQSHWIKSSYDYYSQTTTSRGTHNSFVAVVIMVEYLFVSKKCTSSWSINMNVLINVLNDIRTPVSSLGSVHIVSVPRNLAMAETCISCSQYKYKYSFICHHSLCYRRREYFIPRMSPASFIAEIA